MALQTLNSPTIIPQPTDPFFAFTTPSFPTGKRSNKRKRRNFEEEEYLAMCLVKLARGTNEIIKRPTSLTFKYHTFLEQEKSVLTTMDVNKVQESNAHRCNVCNKVFSSHQALGGHKASHRSKPRMVVSDVKNVKLSSGGKVHECGVCCKTFSTGQALGGHMRKHFDGYGVGVSAKNRRSDGSAAKSPSNDGCATVSTERKIQDFDLNVTVTEDLYCDEAESAFM